MYNIFQGQYDQRLKEWYKLRAESDGKDLKTICIEIDKWWQRAPLVNHYLHPSTVDEWPDPWDLLADNEYCYLARGLGMIYTLHMLGISDVEYVEAKDYNNEDVALVLVDRAKYIMNYWPDSVVNNNLQEFKITKKLDVTTLIKKIG